MRLAVTTTALALVVVLVGCAGTRYDRPYEPHPSYTAVTAHNYELMVFEPEPVYPEGVPPDFHGKRAHLAIDRYETGKVIEPERLRVTEVGGGGTSQ